MKEAASDTRDFLREESKSDWSLKIKNVSFWKRAAVFVAALVLAFLLGFLPMWLSESAAVKQRDAAQADLRLSRIQNRLATAAIDARRGEYEQARVAASDFYTDLRAETDRIESGLTAGQREAVRPILLQRDEIITLLARNEQAAAERLAYLYGIYKQAIAPTSLPSEQEPRK